MSAALFRIISCKVKGIFPLATTGPPPRKTILSSVYSMPDLVLRALTSTPLSKPEAKLGQVTSSLGP